MTPCKSCQSLYSPLMRREKLRERGQSLCKGELEYCLGCADELYRGIIDIKPAQLHSGGGAWWPSGTNEMSPLAEAIYARAEG